MGSFKEKLENILFFIKKYWIVILIGLIVALLLIAYLSGLITQMNVNGTMDISGGEKQPIDKNIFKNFQISFATPQGQKTFGAFVLLICMAIVVFIVIRKMDNPGSMDPDRNFDYSKKNTYGTSGWMSKKEMNNALDVKRVELTYGTILGAIGNDTVSIVPTVRKDSVVKFTDEQKKKSMKTNKHVCVMGSSGSMKSRAFVRPTIFQCIRRGESMIITDPKGEMYEDMAELLRNEGYHVNIFNLKDQIYSDSWDCLAEVTDEVMAQVFCSVIIQNTGGARGDHFWDNAEMNLLKALVLYVTIEHKKNGLPVTMPEVYRLLTTQTVADLERMFKILPQTHPAFVPYSIYAQAGENVRGNVVIGLSSRIQVFQSQVTKNITSFPEIDLTRPGKEKCAYFCAISDQDATFTFLSSLFFAFLFIKLVKYADMFSKTPGKLDVPVNFILDEFSNIGSIPDFEKKISTVRSRDINISVIIQSIPQLKNRYPNDVWQEIIGNCDTQLFLGCTDEMTAKYISDRSGVATIDIQSEQTVRKTLAVAQVVPEYKKTESVGKRNVLTQDEVMRLPGREALVIIRGEKLLKVDKFDFTRHPMSKSMVPSRINSRIPRWHRREMEAEAAGYELRTEKRGGGNLYYFNPKNGTFYERTAFINADDIDELQSVIPKGDTVKVAIDRNVGYQIIRDESGEVYVVNSQTGETRQYYGFDERGELRTEPETIKPAAAVPVYTEETGVSEQLTASVDSVIHKEQNNFVPLPTTFNEIEPSISDRSPTAVSDNTAVPPTKKNGDKPSLSSLFDSLLGPKKERKGEAVLEESMLTSSTLPERGKSMASTARLGSPNEIPEKIFDIPDEDPATDNSIDETDIWGNLRPALEDYKPKQPVPDNSAILTDSVADKDVSEAGVAVESEAQRSTHTAQRSPAKPVQARNKSAKLSGQKPKQNIDLFSLDKKEPKKEKRPTVPEQQSDKLPVEAPTSDTPEIYADELFADAVETETSISIDPFDYIPNNARSEITADSRREIKPEQEAVFEAPEEISEMPPAMSAAEILGELHMAKKSKRSKDRTTGDKDRADTSFDEPSGRDEPTSDWDYAFISSDELFD